jgi:hypothetical protein
MEWGVGPGAVCHIDTDARQGSLEGMVPGPVRFQGEATRYLAGFLDCGECAQRVQIPQQQQRRPRCARIRSVTWPSAGPLVRFPAR